MAGMVALTGRKVERYQTRYNAPPLVVEIGGVISALQDGLERLVTVSR